MKAIHAALFGLALITCGIYTKSQENKCKEQIALRDSVNEANKEKVDSLKNNYQTVVLFHCDKHCNHE